MIIVFLFILFASCAGHIKIDDALTQADASMSMRWLNVAASAVTYSVIFYIGTFFV